MKSRLNRASASPLGVTLLPDGANVAVWSAHAAKIFFCIFDKNDKEVSRTPLLERDGEVHFAFIAGVKSGLRYGLRADGEWQPEAGLLFDSTKLLLDPFAQRIDRTFVYDRRLGERGFDSAPLVPKATVTKELIDLPLRSVTEPQFIYELQVKSFTKLHPDIPVAQRGTISALGHPAILKHLKSIGVDTIELMPITAWIDERHLGPLELTNGWGYNPISFFAPDPRLAPGGLKEIRETVVRLHQHGFNVILDLVFNHSGESDNLGPTLSFRGLDSSSYYRMHGSELANDAGCGNTLALDRPHTVQMVINCLRHWVLKCGIDGFRFDLATIMGRSDDGFHADAPLLKAIEADPILSTRIMIAEPWDVGLGGYQLGNFPPRWYEWNDRYRDDTRRFWHGDEHSANNLATRITGSSDVFEEKAASTRSINFLAAHDGFTLADLTQFRIKNNFANGEYNRDGKDDEVTCVGRDVRALLATLFFSRGTLMLTAGDEFGRTQKGNNNAYAQDNELTWLDWKNANHDLIAFVGNLFRLRKSLSVLTGSGFLSAKPKAGRISAFWFDALGNPLDWDNRQQRFIGLALSKNKVRQVLVINGSDGDARFPLPTRIGYQWMRLFCSNVATECPAYSVCVYEERLL